VKRHEHRAGKKTEPDRGANGRCSTTRSNRTLSSSSFAHTQRRDKKRERTVTVEKGQQTATATAKGGVHQHQQVRTKGERAYRPHGPHGYRGQEGHGALGLYKLGGHVVVRLPCPCLFLIFFVSLSLSLCCCHHPPSSLPAVPAPSLGGLAWIAYSSFSLQTSSSPCCCCCPLLLILEGLIG